MSASETNDGGEQGLDEDIKVAESDNVLPPDGEEVASQPKKRKQIADFVPPYMVNDTTQLPDPADIIARARKLMTDLKMTQSDLAVVLRSSMSSISRLLNKSGEPFLTLSEHNRQLLITLDEWMKGQSSEVRSTSASPSHSGSVPTPTPKPLPTICVTTIPGYLLVFKKLRLSATNGTRLFDNATLSIAVGRRYGLIGNRYSGASALLSYINSSNKRFDISGPGIEVVFCNHSYDGEYEELPENESTIDYVVQRTERWGKLKAEEASLEKVLSTNKNSEVAGRLKKIYEQLHFFVAGDADLKARILLTGLGFPVASQNGPVKMLSYVERKVAKLAQALLTEPDLLLLDSPTNFLDIESVKFLESYLKGWRSSLVVVTQDRAFLDAVCSDIIHIRDKQLFYYEGNYSSFEQQQLQVPKN